MIMKEVPRNNTFIVRVENRQNGTWQGKIIWADEDRTEHFRSVLEMLGLMEEAMAGGAQAAYDLLEQQSV